MFGGAGGYEADNLVRIGLGFGVWMVGEGKTEMNKGLE